MNFIRGTKYVYYKIYNIDKDKNYYGLIDIELNKVLYNFDEEIKTFIPYLNATNRGKYGEMLAVTATSAYKICIIKSGESCNNDCTTISRDPDANTCDTGCTGEKIKLMPDDICIEKNLCNLTIYILNSDESICGLCSYFDSTGDKYRLIGTNGCLNRIPDNTEYYNEKLYLLKCKTNYHLDSGLCVPDSCYEACQSCSEVSTDDTNQKCTSCKSGYTLISGNCIIQTATSIITQAPSTITKSPSTIIKESPSTEIPEVPSNDCTNKRCKECNTESNELELCVSCDESLYKKVNYTRMFSKYFDCVKKENLENKYYLDTETNQYKPCYEKCQKCLGKRTNINHVMKNVKNV